MSTKASYEILIAEKLEQIPLPEMSDHIWANISVQLDAPAKPIDEPSISRRIWYRIIGTIIVVALLCLYYHQKNNTVNKNLPTPIEKKQTPVDTLDQVNKQEKKSIPLPTAIKKDPLSNDQLAIPIHPDTTSKFTAAPIVPDSMIILSTPLLPLTDTSLKQPFVKKPKGVKGISNDDYRLFGQKDTTKKH